MPMLSLDLYDRYRCAAFSHYLPPIQQSYPLSQKPSTSHQVTMLTHLSNLYGRYRCVAFSHYLPPKLALFLHRRKPAIFHQVTMPALLPKLSGRYRCTAFSHYLPPIRVQSYPAAQPPAIFHQVTTPAFLLNLHYCKQIVFARCSLPTPALFHCLSQKPATFHRVTMLMPLYCHAVPHRYVVLVSCSAPIFVPFHAHKELATCHLVTT